MLLNIVAMFGLVAAAATPKQEVTSALALEETVSTDEAIVDELLPEEVAQIEDELVQEEAEVLN